MLVFVVVWVICAIVGALIADRKGRSTALWALVCLITGVFGILVIAVLPRQKDGEVSVSGQSAQLDSGRVPCPACSELILPSAKLCKHCGTTLSPMAIAADPGTGTGWSA